MNEVKKGSIEWRHERKIKAVEWTTRMFEDPGVVVMDTETTGLLSNKEAEIVEIAIVSLYGTVLFDSLIKPKLPIPHYATKIHGISNRDVADKPTFGDVYEEIVDIFNSASMVLVYNKSFDTEMLLRGSELYGLTPFSTRCPTVIGRPDIPTNWFCAMKIYATWVNDWNSYYDDFKFQPLNGGHRALGDCMATIDRLREITVDNQVELPF